MIVAPAMTSRISRPMSNWERATTAAPDSSPSSPGSRVVTTAPSSDSEPVRLVTAAPRRAASPARLAGRSVPNSGCAESTVAWTGMCRAASTAGLVTSGPIRTAWPVRANPAGPTGLSDQYGLAGWRRAKVQVTLTVKVVRSGTSRSRRRSPVLTCSRRAAGAGRQAGTGVLPPVAPAAPAAPPVPVPPAVIPAGQLPARSTARPGSAGSEMICVKAWPPRW